jgi:hypothetical protein
MQVMVIIKATRASEAGELPSPELLSAMGQYNEELARAGVMVAGEGIQPSSKGKRVKFSGDKRIVRDGPFTEAKELVAGFYILRVRSMDEAVEWVKRMPNPMPGEEPEVEIRPVFGADDFAASDPTGEIREAESRLRQQLAGQNQSKGEA